MTCLLVLLFILLEYLLGYHIYGAHEDACLYVTQQQKLSEKGELFSKKKKKKKKKNADGYQYRAWPVF